MVASVPQIPKIVTFTLGSTPVDFSPDVTSVRVVPEPGDVQKVVTLDGVTHQDTQPAAWALELTMVLDWSSSRPGLAYYLFLHKDESVPFAFNAYTTPLGSGSASQPPVSGTCTLVPVAYGGEANVYAEATVSLPITGTPVFDIAP
jgi:hypothetical protein